jgi:pimeloyl-ACP methyl ester carboxylesterase
MSCIKDHSIVNTIMFRPDLAPHYVEDLDKHFFVEYEDGAFVNPTTQSLCCSLILDDGEFAGFEPLVTGNAPVILFCHGNAGNVHSCVPFCKLLAKTTRCHVVAYDYPGYGLSTGDCCESTALKSIEVMMDHMISAMEIPARNIVLFGQSIGTGIAAHGLEYTVAKYMENVAALILLSPYRSIKKLAEDLTEKMTKNSAYATCASAGSFIMNRFDTEDKLKRCTAPLLIIHGERDELIPIAHAIELFNVAKCLKKELHVAKDATHNQFNFGAVFTKIAYFISDNSDLVIKSSYHNVKDGKNLYVEPEDLYCVDSTMVLTSAFTSTCLEATIGGLESGVEATSGSCTLF